MIEVENCPSFIYHDDFIGIDDSLMQEKSLANLGYDMFGKCFCYVGNEIQCVEIIEAQILRQRMLVHTFDTLSSKRVVHPL